MRIIGCISIALWACALPSQLRGAALPGAPAAIPVREMGGSGPPAAPVYEKDGKYVVYEDGGAISWGMLVLRTEIVVPAKVKQKDALIVWRANDSEPLYPTSEEQAQTRGRWVVMVVDKVDLAAGTFTRLGGSDEGIPFGSARSIVESKEVKRTK